MKMNVEELIEHEISNETDNIPENKETLSQSSDSPMEVPIPDFPSQHCNKNNNNTSQEHTQEEIKYIINLVNSCIEEARLLLEKIPEVEEVSLSRLTPDCLLCFVNIIPNNGLLYTFFSITSSICIQSAFFIFHSI